MDTATLEPIAVYDCNDWGGAYSQCSLDWKRELHEWLCSNGVDSNVTDRIEIFLLDAPFATIYQIEPDESGRPVFDPATGHARRREPFRVMLNSLPPAEH